MLYFYFCLTAVILFMYQVYFVATGGGTRLDHALFDFIHKYTSQMSRCETPDLFIIMNIKSFWIYQIQLC